MSCQKLSVTLKYLYYMLIVEINNRQPLEKALKILKGKVIRTKQTENLKNRKEFTKKSVELREQRIKAIYKEKFKESR